jgi:hypothetical protein
MNLFRHGCNLTVGGGSSEQVRTCRASFVAWLGQRDAATVDALIRRRAGPAADGGERRLPDAEAAANALRRGAAALGDRSPSPHEARRLGGGNSGGGGGGGGSRAAAPASSSRQDWAEYRDQAGVGSAHQPAAPPAGYRDDDSDGRRPASRWSNDTADGGGERGQAAGRSAEAAGGRAPQRWEAEGVGGPDSHVYASSRAGQGSAAAWNTPGGSGGGGGSADYGWAVGGLGESRPASSHDKRPPIPGPERGSADRSKEEHNSGAGVWGSSRHNDAGTDSGIGDGGGVGGGGSAGGAGGGPYSGGRGGDEYGGGVRGGGGAQAPSLRPTDPPRPSSASAGSRQHRPGGVEAAGGGNRGGREYSTPSFSGGAYGGGSSVGGGAEEDERAELYSYLR